MVLGVDGATWNVINPMIREGKLPFFKELMDRGTYGNLKSIGGTLSPVVWNSLFTGMMPENHGIRGWGTSLSTFRTRKAVWNFASEAGFSSIVLNVPGTYPPDPVKGSFISGFPMERGFITLHNRGDIHRVAIGKPQKISVPVFETFGGTVDFDIELKLAQTKKPADPPIFAGQVSVGETTHTFALPTGGWSDLLVFSLPDQVRFLATFKILETDEKSVSIYLSPLFRHPDESWSFVEPRSLYGELQEQIGLNYLAEGAGWKMYTDPRTLDLLYEHSVDVESRHVDAGEFLAQNKDWDLFIEVITLTDRISHPYWPFKEPHRYDGISEESAKEYGDRVERCYEEADAYLRRLVEQAGEGTKIFVVSDHGFAAPSQNRRGSLKGWHIRNGVYIAAGPGIQKKGKGEEYTVIDIAPTILYLLGLPIPEDSDGHLMKGILDPLLLRKDQPQSCPPKAAEYRSKAVTEGIMDPALKKQLEDQAYITTGADGQIKEVEVLMKHFRDIGYV